jgi:hypothetical protein
VLTINLNRCIQYAVKNGMHYLAHLEEIVDLVHKVQIAYNENLKELKAKGMLPLFDAGYINLARQYLTVGVNGLVEAADSWASASTTTTTTPLSCRGYWG